MRIILGSFALVALIGVLIVCGSNKTEQTVTTTLGGNSQPIVQTSDEVVTQDNVGSDEDEYGRPRNKNRRHLFPRLHRQK